ncbi:MAG: S-layer homology domain-containing protein [Oscillibacter sp.]|nr:S-layer homology domain-containing protein [Oscillibacter sp.]
MRLFRRITSAFLAAALLSAALSVSASAASTGFTDVPSTNWAAASITRAARAGLVQGVTKTTFGLGRTMTRAAFTVILCRFFAWDMVSPSVGSFTDNRSKNAWYYSAVETACANGAVTKQSGTFRPNDAITREEMAVMLVRALGYTTLAGLDQGIACPFTDVESNTGYLTMAYYLGISSGTGAAAFSPEKTATREQAVVMLMRVYDQYLKKTPQKLGIAASADNLTALKGYTAVGISAKKLTVSGTLSTAMTDKDVTAVTAAVTAAGAKRLVHISGSAAALRNVKAAELVAAVNDGGYDGLMLDIAAVPAAQKESLTFLVTALNGALGSKLLYVVSDTPTSDGTAYGFDYAALAGQADKLILRTPAYQKAVNGFPTAPLEPLEEVYYALVALKRAGVSGGKLSLWLTTTGSVWTGSSAIGSVQASEIEALLGAASVSGRYSSRYAAAYLSRSVNGTRTVIWYNDGQSAAARVQLGAFLGVTSVCLSDLSSVANYADYSVVQGLSA